MVKVTNSFSAKLGRISGPAKTGLIGRALKVAGDQVAVEAQISITSGSISGKQHVPSRPGEPPNNDTGVLAGNIESAQVEPLKVEVSSNAPYAAALELGTSKMAARPYMGPALNAKRDDIIRLIARAVEASTK